MAREGGSRSTLEMRMPSSRWRYHKSLVSVSFYNGRTPTLRAPNQCKNRRRRRGTMKSTIPDLYMSLILVVVVLFVPMSIGAKMGAKKSCSNAQGEKGRCMFVWECIKTDGKHLGTCTDGFLYGSCCGKPDHTEDSKPSTQVPSHDIDDEENSLESPLAEASQPQVNGIASAFSGLASSSSTNATWEPRPLQQHMKPAGSPTLPTVLSIANLPVQHKQPVAIGGPYFQFSRPPTMTTLMTHSLQRWPPTIRPTIVNSFWSIFRPRPTLLVKPGITMPIIALKPATTPVRPTIIVSSPLTSPLMQPSVTSPASVSTIQRSSTTTTTTSTQATTKLQIPTLKPQPSTSNGGTLAAAAAAAEFENNFIETGGTESCGVPPLRPQKKVVGGKTSSFGQWPWQASVRRSSFFGFSSTHRCGGAILNKNWIITAAHCVDDLLVTQVRVRLGEFDFSSTQEPYPFQERGITAKYVHPQYNFFTYENDLALLKMDKSLQYMPHVAAICLPPDTTGNLVGQNATVTGWGRLNEGGVLPSLLQEVQVPIVSNEKCKTMFQAAGRNEFIPSIFMCAGYENGGKDSCQGDSGGPLQVRDTSGRWMLAGIISWGIGCAEPNLPGVCTRITKFKPWIVSTIRKHS
ncbi:serine proteinase stubble-like [Varroa jacobsoni]|uniref:Peptidase S1 domain-containing protein n=1 Tax=Varroa destructor TaxID=109461 RepID=A0A7M7JDN6_VARDE|nr:serine proteinase stubble-like [Varroa destructor]XP_022648512.1 serine proteinase stubble-like [Varroa destructor]XP_022648523.1 serine proteinase stubble-like [Varroa destructor]XP_022648532.1 serine proteinase stubble-like [Varroa destructor]XP_022689558.1 serine proteinase stubble-like [Varroa jacobsoni]XP_022689559.1 serine proteinase stubble-like [Varroa jacobsoni]XP_022689560.1 serine proteinase stubble-like [Varroa jacobsoni]